MHTVVEQPAIDDGEATTPRVAYAWCRGEVEGPSLTGTVERRHVRGQSRLLPVGKPEPATSTSTLCAPSVLSALVIVMLPNATTQTGAVGAETLL